MPAVHKLRAVQRAAAAAVMPPAGTPASQIPQERVWQETTAGGKQVTRREWSTKIRQPTLMDRNLSEVEGERWARRPCAMAKMAGKRYAADMELADGVECLAPGPRRACACPQRHGRRTAAGWPSL